MTYTFELHIPHGSGDGEWHILRGDVVIAIIDPSMLLEQEESGALAELICAALNKGG